MPRFAAFRVGPRTLAIDVDHILGFTREPVWTRLPGARPGVVGICNWRGEVCPLVDMGQLMGVEGSGGPWACVTASGAGMMAILADSVIGLEHGEPTPVDEDVFSGTYAADDGERFVLSLEEVARLCAT